jgi:hypothetical protein
VLEKSLFLSKLTKIFFLHESVSRNSWWRHIVCRNTYWVGQLCFLWYLTQWTLILVTQKYMETMYQKTDKISVGSPSERTRTSSNEENVRDEQSSDKNISFLFWFYNLSTLLLHECNLNFKLLNYPCYSRVHASSKTP